MKVTWDETKNLANQAKHGVSFEEASTVLEDPLSYTIEDRRHSVGDPNVGLRRLDGGLHPLPR